MQAKLSGKRSWASAIAGNGYRDAGGVSGERECVASGENGEGERVANGESGEGKGGGQSDERKAGSRGGIILLVQCQNMTHWRDIHLTKFQTYADSVYNGV